MTSQLGERQCGGRFRIFSFECYQHGAVTHTQRQHTSSPPLACCAIQLWDSMALTRALCVAVLPLFTAAVHPADLLPAHARGGSLYASLAQDRDAELTHMKSTLRLPPMWLPNVTASWKTALVDNLDPQGAKFQQRFFYDTSFCGVTCYTTAPIVMEVSGEWTVAGAPNTTVAELGLQLGAVLVNLEHRWYGASLPAPLVNKGFMQASLSVEQALEDTASFIKYFEAMMSVSGTTPGPQRKWVIVGGSYAGALVSWFTVKHGDLVTATWASSGVVDAIFNFTAFDQTVATAVGPACAGALRGVTAAFEDAWVTSNAALLALFNSPPGFYTQQDFAWMLADSAAMGPQYGRKDKL